MPCLPVAAISAAKLIVSLNDVPYDLEISFAVSATSFLILLNSADDVAAIAEKLKDVLKQKN